MAALIPYSNIGLLECSIEQEAVEQDSEIHRRESSLSSLTNTFDRLRGRMGWSWKVAHSHFPKRTIEISLGGDRDCQGRGMEDPPLRMG